MYHLASDMLPATAIGKTLASFSILATATNRI
jgi:hypothetical protein